MNWTISLFFLYCWGFGFSATKFIKKSEDPFESHIMNVGIGLALFVVLGLVLNLLHIPLDWRIFLVLSFALPLISLITLLKNKNFTHLRLQFKQRHLFIIFVFILFLFTFYMYHHGAFAYPYLEDDDPWTHAVGAKFVSIEKRLFITPEEKDTRSIEYIDAYPPGYDLVFGILHQTSSDMMWTLKFFNALIISLGILFFYFFAERFMMSKKKAIFATFFLALIPAYLSHFIWAHAFIPTLLFVALYCIEKIKESRLWFIPSSLVFASFPLIQPMQPIKIGVMIFFYWIAVVFFTKKKSLWLIGSIIFGYFISFILWWIPMLIRYKSELLVRGLGWTAGVAGAISEKAGVFGPIGSATRLYDLKDFLLLNKPGMSLFDGQNMINNPVGIGVVICLLCLLGILIIILRYRSMSPDSKTYRITLLLWLFFNFTGLYGGTVFPIALESFMFWMLLAIPVSMLAADGFYFLTNIFKSNKLIYIISIIVVILLVWYTSGHQKFEVNTAQWGPGGWLGPAPGALNSFLWMKENFPIDTPVFGYSILGSMAIGFNLYSCEWCPDIPMFRKSLQNKSIEETYTWLKNKGYKHVMIDEYFVKEYGLNKTIDMANNMIASNLYSFEYQPSSNGQKMLSFVFKVN